MPDDDNRPDELQLAPERAERAHGMALPLSCQACQESPAEYIAGMAVWTGDLQVVLGPDGDLYYATYAGDGQLHRIVSP